MRVIDTVIGYSPSYGPWCSVMSKQPVLHVPIQEPTSYGVHVTVARLHLQLLHGTSSLCHHHVNLLAISINFDSFSDLAFSNHVVMIWSRDPLPVCHSTAEIRNIEFMMLTKVDSDYKLWNIHSDHIHRVVLS